MNTYLLALLLSLSPGASWNGTINSGYAGNPPTAVARSTAKPVCNWNEVPMQVFTADYNVGVVAFAKGGIQKVRFYCEGNTVDVTDWALNSRTGKYEYFCTLTYADFSGDGDINLYAEAYPNDTGMQKRLIGPFRLRRSATTYDATLTIAPSQSEIVGSRYTSIKNALTYCNTVPKKARPLITIMESGTYDAAAQGSAFTALATGWATITTDTGVTATIRPGTYGLLRPKYDGVRYKGSGIIIDLGGITQVYGETAIRI
jgi:hypothetical protein